MLAIMSCFCASTAGADIVTERMVFEQMVQVATTHCENEWHDVLSYPVQEIDYDSLQEQVDRSTDKVVQIDEDVYWPFSVLHFRQTAHVIVVAADVGLLVPLLLKAREYDERRLSLSELRHYATGYRNRRAFQECLKLSSAENLEYLGTKETIYELRKACLTEFNDGVDSSIEYILNTEAPVDIYQYANNALSAFAECSAKNKN